MKHKEPDQWTPKRVGEVLAEAVAWCRYAAGPVGPAGIRSGMPQVIMSMEDRLEEWGLPDGPDAEEEEALRREMKRRIAPSPARITLFEAALTWPTVYVVPTHPGDARVLSIWVRCKAYRRPFNEAVDRRQYLSRAMAYRMRDRALSMIAVGLDRDGQRP